MKISNKRRTRSLALATAAAVGIGSGGGLLGHAPICRVAGKIAGATAKAPTARSSAKARRR